MPHDFDSLFALPVKGDAFLYRAKGKVLLVDGGEEPDRLAASLNILTPEVTHIDVVVCTHADEDHAKGLCNLLRKNEPRNVTEWGGTVGEFWLPGRWTDVVPEVLKDPKGFVDLLVAELDRIAAHGGGHPDWSDDGSPADEADDRLDDPVSAWFAHVSGAREGHKDGGAADNRAEGLPEEEDNRQREATSDGSDRELSWDPPIHPKWWNKLRDEVGDILSRDKVAGRAFKSARERVVSRVKKGKISASLGRLWVGFIDTLEIIRNIAKQALEFDVPVRWFDFDEYEKSRKPRGGIHGLLQPINAVELDCPPAPVGLRSYMLHLSKKNRQSLVFYAPGNALTCGVLFCADSPLAVGRGHRNSFFATLGWKPLERIIATAPHHGSHSNDGAYSRVNAWATVALWVRSGGKSRHPEPDAVFRSLSSNIRACTNCPHQPHPLRGECILLNFPQMRMAIHPGSLVFHYRSGDTCSC
ncbi:MBL fold metallo-hydrolase [Azospirillum sp. TSH58]|uniref:MBL fold metallo-hydrolase n=1 Tax=Azospirillum sp. TSH58 TaxID=664962 RepID=UPI000D642B34|nr:MBL fold metallo-hydrolase [Azospirillum sp. TSH58]